MKVQWDVVIRSREPRPSTVSATEWRQLQTQAVSAWRGSLFSDMMQIWVDDITQYFDDDGIAVRHLTQRLIEWRKDFTTSLISQASRLALVPLETFELVWVGHIASDQIKIIRINALADTADDDSISCTIAHPSDHRWD